jgi:DNA-binding winged helix-turn-helix (wHTH) protein
MRRTLPLHVRFGAFTFDEAARELRRLEQRVHLSPKAVDLLAVLLRNRPSAVSKADLHGELCPDSFVSDGSLAVLILEIRRALGDSPHPNGSVRTVNRFGYAFAGAAVDVAAERSPGNSAAICSLKWDRESTRLKTGENLLGRDSDADVCIDAVGVSRRHALLVVGGEAVTLQDLSSKNGTFVNGTRVTSPIVLPDRAEIRLGGLCIQFRRLRPVAATQTVSGSGIPIG